MREIVVDVQHVSKSFGSEQVLEDVTLQLMRGKIHGIIGRNGSGKTVLMKCICGFLRPTTGKISVFGKNIGTDCDFAPKTGMLIETPRFFAARDGHEQSPVAGEVRQRRVLRGRGGADALGGA